MSKCEHCPVTSGDCHGTGPRPHFCALAASGAPGALMLIRDVSGGNFDPPPKPVLPGLLKMAAAFAHSAVKHAAAGMPQVSDEVYAARLKACETSGPGGSACPNLVLPEWRCGGMTGCGCWLRSALTHPGKARWAGQTCPLGKWPE